MHILEDEKKTNFPQKSYDEAFSRNLGWLTDNEQDLISKVKIAIPGLGGVGGHHLHCLLRMGFRRFHIADLDQFELGNFNRQFGATVSSIGKEKVDVLKEIALDINPGAEIKTFPKGVSVENIPEFLDGVHIVADSLDLYASDLRTPLYDHAVKNDIMVVTAGPFGMGTSVMAFDPKIMGYNEYFDFGDERLTMEAKIIRFLVGLSPSMMHRTYVAKPEAVALFEGRLPSLHVGCYSASAVLGSTILKIVLKRGVVDFAPKGNHYDFYLNKHKPFWRPWGNRNWIQRFMIKRVLKMFQLKEFK